MVANVLCFFIVMFLFLQNIKLDTKLKTYAECDMYTKITGILKALRDTRSVERSLFLLIMRI